jgi:hypothetical protein
MEVNCVERRLSFDFAQDGPFDFAQDGPFDFAQDGRRDVSPSCVRCLLRERDAPGLAKGIRCSEPGFEATHSVFVEDW